jgi:Uma2 family endonuclease
MADTASASYAGTEHRLHRFTLREFFEAYEATLHKTGRRFELLDGGIYEMPADGPRTIRWNAALARWLFDSLGPEYLIVPDKTLEAAEYWGPSPDFYIFDASLREEDVRGPDVLLAIEVSDTTLAEDLRLKRPGYERAGVRDLWIIDVANKTNLVHRLGPHGAYGEPRKVAFDEEVEALLIPGLKLRLSDLPRLRG